MIIHVQGSHKLSGVSQRKKRDAFFCGSNYNEPMVSVVDCRAKTRG